MSQEFTPDPQTQRQTSLGDQIRNIADRLQQETDVQIKATSRILGAAAQISKNYDRLVDEIVDMVEEDLSQQTQTFLRQIYTVDSLKQKFKTLHEAKSYFGVKANSWQALVNKLNDPSFQTPVPEKKPQPAAASRSTPEKKFEGLTVRLEPDVAEMFPDSAAVNEALRFLIRIAKDNTKSTDT